MSGEAMTDRRVHAAWAQMDVVRYDRAGKWYLEPRPSDLPRQHVTVKEAAEYAVWGKAARGGRIHLGLPGGEAFDRHVLQKPVQKQKPRPSGAER